MQTTKIVHEYTPQALETILELDKKSFEKQYEDAKEYYKEALENRENVNILLKEGDKIIGYLLALPHNNVYKELKAIDSEMREDAERLY